ncbi:MAG: energy transducer TonB [Syntrophothermus sp.]
MKASRTPAARTVSLDELIFANRNKDYGAYLLRRHYARNISIALALSISIATAFSAASLVLNRSADIIPTDVPDKKDLTVNLNRPIAGIKEKPDRASDAPKGVHKPTVKYMEPEITPDYLAKDELMPTNAELINATPSTETRKGDVNGIDYIPIETGGTGGTDGTGSNRILIEEPQLFAEQMPQFPGGTSSLLSFINENIRYPEIARRVSIEGKVYVQFVVEKDGSLSHMEVIKSIGGGCDEEALRVCRLMANWLPGMQNGKAVRVRMVIPFHFRLNS